jgi:hypothetical protein
VFLAARGRRTGFQPIAFLPDPRPCRVCGRRDALPARRSNGRCAGRRFKWCAFSAFRSCARVQVSSSTIWSRGAAIICQSSRRLGREIRLPVSGFFTIRTLFQTRARARKNIPRSIASDFGLLDRFPRGDEGSSKTCLSSPSPHPIAIRKTAWAVSGSDQMEQGSGPAKYRGSTDLLMCGAMPFRRR